MPLELTEKQALVEDVRHIAKDALSLVIADARGVSSNSMNALRKDAYASKVVLRVVKNSLVKRALENTEFDCVREQLKGPSLFGFSMEDPSAAAKLFKAFTKEESSFQLKIASLGGELWGTAKIDKLASLPTRDQALETIARLGKAPLYQVASMLNAMVVRLVRVTDAVAKAAPASANPKS